MTNTSDVKGKKEHEKREKLDKRIGFYWKKNQSENKRMSQDNIEHGTNCLLWSTNQRTHRMPPSLHFSLTGIRSDYRLSTRWKMLHRRFLNWNSLFKLGVSGIKAALTLQSLYISGRIHHRRNYISFVGLWSGTDSFEISWFVQSLSNMFPKLPKMMTFQKMNGIRFVSFQPFLKNKMKKDAFK